MRAAAILGLDKRVGKIAPGADGQLVLMNGDPLSVTSVVEHVVIDGKHVYDRSKDVRVRQLLDGTRPAGTTSEDPGDEEWGGDGDDGTDPADDDGKDG